MIEYGSLKKAEAYFEDLLNNNKISFFKEHDFSSRSLNICFTNLYTIYTLFLSLNTEGPPVKHNFILSSQETFGRRGTFKGYILLQYPLGIVESISIMEKRNSMFCAFSEKDDEIIFKPIIWMMKYRDKVNFFKDKPMLIRIEPVTKEELPPDKEFREIKHEMLKIKDHYIFTINGQSGYGEGRFGIYHKELFTISQTEMESFLQQHNVYSSIWKLSFKTTKNILGV